MILYCILHLYFCHIISTAGAEGNFPKKFTYTYTELSWRTKNVTEQVICYTIHDNNPITLFVVFNNKAWFKIKCCYGTLIISSKLTHCYHKISENSLFTRCAFIYRCATLWTEYTFYTVCLQIPLFVELVCYSGVFVFFSQVFNKKTKPMWVI